MVPMGRRLAATACLGILSALAQCRTQPVEVTLCHAGILAPLLQEAAQLFERNNPSVRVRLLPSSDLEVVGRVLQQGGCDLAAVTDWRLIRRFLLPGREGEAYGFLGDEMVLAARPGLLADPQERERWRREWPSLLLAGEARLGLADPRRHAIGYQTHLVWKLTEIRSGRPGLYRRFLELLESMPLESQTAPSELVRRLKDGRLDFAFLYRSAAVANGLDQIRLPSEVSLGEPGLGNLYARVFFTVDGLPPLRRFEADGAPIRHGLCRLNPSGEAAGLLEFLLGPEVEEIARGQGYTRIPVERFAAQEGR